MANRLKRDTNDSSHHVSTPDHADFTITDVDFRLCIVMADYTPASDNNLVGKTNAVQNSSEWKLDLTTSGTLRYAWYDGAAQLTSVSAALTTVVSAGQPIWLRVTHDVDNGATQNVVTFYYSLESPDTDPGSVTWTQLTQDVNAGTTSIVAGTNPIKIGWSDRFAFGNYLDSYYYFEMRNAIGGTIVANPDFRTTTQGDWAAAIGGGTVTDDQGKVWTVNGIGWTYIAGSTPNILILGLG